MWVILSTDGTRPSGGAMDRPGRWTDDFELWVDDMTAEEQGRPNFAERLVQFAPDGSSSLVPGTEGVEILHQVSDPEFRPGWPPTTRAAAAEVRWGGMTWFVEASNYPQDPPWFQALAGASQPDFASFLVWLRRGA